MRFIALCVLALAVCAQPVAAQQSRNIPEYEYQGVVCEQASHLVEYLSRVKKIEPHSYDPDAASAVNSKKPGPDPLCSMLNGRVVLLKLVMSELEVLDRKVDIILIAITAVSHYGWMAPTFPAHSHIPLLHKVREDSH